MFSGFQCSQSGLTTQFGHEYAPQNAPLSIRKMELSEKCAYALNSRIESGSVPRCKGRNCRSDIVSSSLMAELRTGANDFGEGYTVDRV